MQTFPLAHPTPDWPRSRLIQHGLDRYCQLARCMFGRPGDSQRPFRQNGRLKATVIRLHTALDHICPSDLRVFAGVAARHMRQLLCELASGAVAGFAGRDVTGWGVFHAMVDDLPEHEREVLDLLLYWGLKLAEVAGVLGITPGDVECRWREARCMLQNALHNWIRTQR